MELNHELVRKILILMEDFYDIHGMTEDYLMENLNGYEREEVVYTVIKLNEGNLITGGVIWGSNKPVKINVENLTYQGHELLDNIRDEKIWSETKKITSKFSSVSLTFLKDVAATVISNIITNNIN